MLTDFNPTEIIISDMCPLLEDSNTNLLVPKARIPYVVNNFVKIKNQLQTFGICVELNLKDL